MRQTQRIRYLITYILFHQTSLGLAKTKESADKQTNNKETSEEVDEFDLNTKNNIFPYILLKLLHAIKTVGISEVLSTLLMYC